MVSPELPHAILMKGEKMKKVRVHAVVTGSNGTTGAETDTFTQGFTLAALCNLMQELNTIFNKVDIEILFDPIADFTELKDPLLNDDVPCTNDKIITPPKSVDDFTGNPNVVAQRKFADNLQGHLVLFFRDFADEKYKYIHEDGQNYRDIPWNFSGGAHLYVRLYKTTESDRVAHEMGHYFHLAHTHGPKPESIAEAAALIRKAVEGGSFSKDDAMLVFDGDRTRGVLDTPPDPSGGVMAAVNGGNKSGSINTAQIPVTFNDGTQQTYALTPDRLNAMSYFQSCQNTNSVRFSDDQKNVIVHTMEQDNRAHLLGQIPGRHTVVLSPGSEDERFIYAWKYEQYRKKYDAIWADGWRLHILNNYQNGPDTLYTAVFRKTGGAEKQLYSWTYDAYRNQYDHLWADGWRLHILNNYVVNGRVRYTAVFRKTGVPEIQLYGWSYDAFRDKYDELWKDGWRLEILSNYVLDDDVKYTAVFRKSIVPEKQLYGWSYGAYRAEYDKLWKDGWRLHILNNYEISTFGIGLKYSKVKYTAVFRKTNGTEIQLYSWKYRQLREELDARWHNGMRVKILNVF
jgi:hypothetical protein